MEYTVRGRRFYLLRLVDDSGVSGTGVVAEGWVDPHGEAVLVWVAGDKWSTEIHHTLENLLAIHGHGDHTTLVWIDN
jgi:hypothetical protein